MEQTAIETMVAVASIGQLSQIRQLNSKYLFYHFPEREKANGFIRIEYKEEQIEQLIEHNEIVVAKANNNVVGYYLIGKKSGNLALSYQAEETKMWAERNGIAFDEIGFGCQVCIDESYRSNGLFASMLNQLCKHVKGKNTYLLCSISENNTSSLRAHGNNGWRQIDNSGTTRFFIYDILQQTNN